MPESHYRHHIDIAAIATPSDVIDVLLRLDTLLPSSELASVKPFNHAYLIITHKIEEASAAGEFGDPDSMSRLEIAFARYYFEALNHYVNDGVLPGAWGKINHGRWRPWWLALMLGANAHINHDLTGALGEAIAQPAQFEGDYVKVDRLLLDSAPLIVRGHRPDKSVGPLRRRLQDVYPRPVMWLILHWRQRVWREFAGERL